MARIPFFNITERADRSLLRRLYADWCARNLDRWNFNVSIIAITSMAILIPFDLILFEGYYYPIMRTLIIAGLFMIYLFSKSEMISDKVIKLQLSMVSTTFLVSICYIYFLATAEQSHRFIVLTGISLVIIFSNIGLHRFSGIQLTYASAMLVACICQMGGSHKVDFALLAISNIISAIFAFVFRRDFVSNIVEKYLLMRSMVPEQIANFITTSGGNESLDQAFPVKNRMVCCVCSDWRGYQELASKVPPLELAKMQESFYDLVFEEIQKIDSTGCHFVNWTADELFVVFYDPSSESNVIDKAVNLSLALQTSIFDKFNATSVVPIMYDVGVSCGTGALGIQGPKRYKKTTITGAVTGYAKRFETEAKVIRRQKDSEAPIIVTTKAALLDSSFKATFLDAEEIEATSKDIAGLKVTTIYRHVTASSAAA